MIRLSDGEIVEDQRTLGVHDPPPVLHAQKSAHPASGAGARGGAAMIGPEMLRIAWSGITANKLRSGLTILGMTIGVASVIVLIAVGNGSSKAVQSHDPEPRHQRAAWCRPAAAFAAARGRAPRRPCR